MTEAMNEQNEFEKALDYLGYETIYPGDPLGTHVPTILKALEFMAANHEALREGDYLTAISELAEYIELKETEYETASPLEKHKNIINQAYAHVIGAKLSQDK